MQPEFSTDPADNPELDERPANRRNPSSNKSRTENVRRAADDNLARTLRTRTRSSMGKVARFYPRQCVGFKRQNSSRILRFQLREYLDKNAQASFYERRTAG
jgi:hypothetical protein